MIHTTKQIKRDHVIETDRQLGRVNILEIGRFDLLDDIHTETWVDRCQPREQLGTERCRQWRQQAQKAKLEWA